MKKQQIINRAIEEGTGETQTDRVNFKNREK